MHQPAPERAQVRHQLDEGLRTDAELDAFCLDYFPEVQRRFARGMERTDKVNLLLSVAELADIVAKLHQHASLPRTFLPRPRWRWVAMAGILLTLSGGGPCASFHHEAKSGPAALPAAPALATGQPSLRTSNAAMPKGINSGNLILDSTGAELRNRAPSAALRDRGATINSGNRIEGSPGTVISNEVGGP